MALIAYVWTTYGVAPTCFRGIPPAQPITKSTKSSAIGSVTSSSSKDKLNKDNAIWIASKMLMPQAIYRLAILDPNPPSAGCLSFWLGGHNSTELVSHSWHFGRWIRSDGEISIDAFCEDMDIFLSSQVSSAIEKYTK